MNYLFRMASIELEEFTAFKWRFHCYLIRGANSPGRLGFDTAGNH